jgi:capsular exopolysaccharide synthesis family protein
MSHLRNLLYRSSNGEPGNSASATAVAGEASSAKASAALPATPVLRGEAPALSSGVATIADFPMDEANFTPEARIIFHTAPRDPAADRFRLLRMHLRDIWRTGRLKKLLITGALAGDGKSTVTMNLATALVERGRRSVLVVEADLHHTAISEVLRLKQKAGMSDCLVDETLSPLACIRRIEPFGWHLLSAGEPRKNSTELLQGPNLGRILNEAAASFDWVLIDSPPVVPLTDTVSLQQHADATLLVVRAEQTPREAVEQTISLLGKKNILGIVLNGVEPRNHRCYQYYERYGRQNVD